MQDAPLPWLTIPDRARLTKANLCQITMIKKISEHLDHNKYITAHGPIIPFMIVEISSSSEW